MPKNLSRRYRMARIIQSFDSSADQRANPLQSGMSGGINKSKIDMLLECPGLAKRMRESCLRKLPENNRRVYFSWDLPGFLWNAILSSKALQKMITEYLGPNVRLDDLYVKTVLDGYDSTSEGWHDDNVGYRLKLFMVFDTEGEPSGTLVMPTDRPNLYRVRLVEEMARMLKKPIKERRARQELVTYTPGDCLTFDTNLLHRGDYSAGTGVRYCVIAEFIDRDKADALRGRAPCGPGQGRQKIVIPTDTGVDLEAHPLIDQTLLFKDGHSITYGY